MITRDLQNDCFMMLVAAGLLLKDNHLQVSMIERATPACRT